MRTILDALLLLVIFKGLTYLFFPKFIQDFVGQHIIDAPLPRLKQFGCYLLLVSAAAYALFIKDIS